MTDEFIYLLKSNFVGLNRLFILVYKNQDADSKRFKSRSYYLAKGIIDNQNAIVNGKNYDQATDSDEKRYEENRKLITD